MASWTPPAAPTAPVTTPGSGWGGSDLASSGVPSSSIGAYEQTVAAAPSADSLPPLELPDEVDATPPEVTDSGEASARLTRVLLTGLVATLVCFFGFLAVRHRKVQSLGAATASATASSTPSLSVGEFCWSEARSKFARKEYAQAATSAQQAFDFFKANGADKKKLGEIKALRNKAWTRQADSLFDKARAAMASKRYNEAMARAEEARGVYLKLSSKKASEARSLFDSAQAALARSGGKSDVPAASDPQPSTVADVPRTDSDSHQVPTGTNPAPSGQRPSGGPAQPPASAPAQPKPQPRNNFVPSPPRPSGYERRKTNSFGY